MSLSKFARADVFLVTASTIIILMAIAISAVVHGPTEKPFSQVITFGPVWTTNAWICNSSSEFIVHGALIAYGDSPSILSIAITGRGNQPDFQLTPLKMESFSVGGPAGGDIIIASSGTITGYLTLQTTSDAEASCVPRGG